jgi:hypothetical protein
VFTPPVFTAPPPVFTAPPPVFTAPPPVFTAPPPVFTPPPPPVFTPPSFSISDERDKTDIQSLDLGLEFLQSIIPAKYVWNMRDGSRVNEKDFGFIAQNLLEAENSIENGDWLRLVDKSNPDQYRINPNRLIPILVRAIQELSAEIEQLKNKE